MAIIITANHDHAMEYAKAQGRYDQLGGYNGIKALFDHYEALSEDGEDIELDVVAWCCEWNTYDSIGQFFQDYSGYDDDVADMDDDEKLEFVRDLTWVVPFMGGVHVYQF